MRQGWPCGSAAIRWTSCPWIQWKICRRPKQSRNERALDLDSFPLNLRGLYCIVGLCAWLLFGIWGCTDDQGGIAKSKPQIGYRFYSTLDSIGDSTHKRDEVSQGLLDLFQRLQENSEIHAAWTNWPA